MLRLKVIFIITTLYSLQNITAQVSDYQFSSTTGQSLYDMSSGTTTLISNGVDDGASSVTNIGFTFSFGCSNNYTQFSVNSNGLMRLGGTVVSTAYSNSLASGSNDPKITAYWDDISTGSAASGSKVHYKLFGSAPNQYLVVEWLVVTPYNTTAAYNSTFQVVLYETSNTIKFFYGTVAAGTSYSVGLAESSTNYLSVSTATNTSSSTTVNNSNSSAITSGLCYTFALVSSGPQLYSSSTVQTANTNTVTTCSTSQAIVAIKIVLNSCYTAEDITQFQISMNGSTSGTLDVSKIHIYYTGSSSSFLGINAFDGTGTTVANGTISINGSRSLGGGTHYFWIAYDISGSATVGNVVDAECTQFTLGGVNRVPSVTAPAGSRTIVTCPYTTIASYPLTANLTDQTTNYGNATISGGTGPTATGACLDGTYATSVAYTPNLSTLDATDFQIEVEFSINSIGVLQPIIIGGNSYRWIGIQVSTTGYIGVLYNNSNFVTSSTSISTGTYYTARLMYTTGSLQLYLDDALIYENLSIPSPLTHGSDFDLWTINYSNGTALNGCIRNLVISNSAGTTEASQPLPVEFLNASVECVENGIAIGWVTASESQNDYFTLGRSFDGYFFEPIKKIESSGTTSNKTYYSFVDPIDLDGRIAYYRISQTDINGREEHLDVHSVFCESDKEKLNIQSFTKVQSGYRLVFESNEIGKHFVSITDQIGRKIFQREVEVSDSFTEIYIDIPVEENVLIVKLQTDKNQCSDKYLNL